MLMGLELKFIYINKTYYSNFFDDTIDCQSQQEEENTDNVSSLLESSDSTEYINQDSKLLNVIKSQKKILNFSFEQKNEQIFFCISALAL